MDLTGIYADIDWGAVITLVMVTTLSPGPNNLSCGTMGVNFGFRRSNNYLIGIGTGLAALMLIIGWVTNAMRNVFPAFEPVLRVIGALYLLYLAYTTFTMNYAEDGKEAKPLGFFQGVLLQFLNPKVIIFGLTLYTAYLLPLTGRFLPLFISAFILGFRGYLINLVWVLFGSAIRRYLSNPLFARIFNLAVALLLVYAAADMIGLPARLAAEFA